ncbi:MULTISPECIES: hypothetical protein [Cupriavidus]
MPRSLTDPVEPASFADPGLVGVDERLQWRSQVFEERAAAHGAGEGWEAWRVDELARALAQQHALFIGGGTSFDEALARIDVMLTPKNSENT